MGGTPSFDPRPEDQERLVTLALRRSRNGGSPHGWDLKGHKRKPDDIVKDLWIGTEGYLKAITGQKNFAAPSRRCV